MRHDFESFNHGLSLSVETQKRPLAQAQRTATKSREAAIGGVFDIPIWMQMQRMAAQSPSCRMLHVRQMSALGFEHYLWILTS